MSPLRPLAVAASTIALLLGGAATAVATTEPPDGTAPGTGGPGCAEVTAALDAADEFFVAFLTGETELLATIVPTLPQIGADAAAAAPPEIAEAVTAWVAPLEQVAAALVDADFSDPEAVSEAVAGIDTTESDEAYPLVQEWAATTCGWEPQDSDDVVDDIMADAPEPADCTQLDAAAAAAAAGVDVAVDDLDGTGDFNLPGFATESCSYGNGAMTLSTLSFNSLEDAQQFYTDNLDNLAGELVEVDLGALPASTLVLRTGVVPTSAPDSTTATSVAATVQVAVFEAPIPFSVSFSGDEVTPEQVVAAAEAVVGAQGAGTAVGGSVPTASDVTEVSAAPATT